MQRVRRSRCKLTAAKTKRSEIKANCKNTNRLASRLKINWNDATQPSHTKPPIHRHERIKAANCLSPALDQASASASLSSTSTSIFALAVRIARMRSWQRSTYDCKKRKGKHRRTRSNKWEERTKLRCPTSRYPKRSYELMLWACSKYIFIYICILYI